MKNFQDILVPVCYNHCAMSVIQFMKTKILFCGFATVRTAFVRVLCRAGQNMQFFQEERIVRGGG